MQRDWIEKMKITKRLRLSLKDWLIHYNIPLFILFIPLLSLISLFEYYVTKTYDGVRSPIDLIEVSAIFSIPVIVMYIYQRSKLRLREFKIEIDKTQFEFALEKTTKENKWFFETKDNDFYRLYTDKDGEGEFGGEMITIINLKSGFLINSVEDISISSSFFQKKKNKENITIFISDLDNVKR